MKNQNIPNLLTVGQFCNSHKAFRVGGLRALIFNEKINGLSESGAIIRMGRKILIDETKFFGWITNGSGGK